MVLFAIDVLSLLCGKVPQFRNNEVYIALVKEAIQICYAVVTAMHETSTRVVQCATELTDVLKFIEREH